MVEYYGAEDSLVPYLHGNSEMRVNVYAPESTTSAIFVVEKSGLRPVAGDLETAQSAARLILAAHGAE